MAEAEMQMNAVERVKHYTTLTPESYEGKHRHFFKQRLGLALGLRQLFGKCAISLQRVNQLDGAQAQGVVLKRT